MTPYDFCQPHLKALEALGDYACLDAKTFEGCINPKKKSAILARLQEATDRGARDVGMGAAVSFGTQWNLQALKNVYDRVVASKAGICTSFAKAAAYVMTKDRAEGDPKVEIVAFKNHVFALVGRPKGDLIAAGKGVFAKKQLPAHSAWGFGWILVDVWARAMGYEKALYLNANGYPYMGMLSPLELVMATE